MFGFLIRMARQAVDQVLSQLTQQLNIVHTSGLDPMAKIVETVSGGTIWKGEGANAFVDEVSHLMIPGVGRVGEHITHMSRNVQAARDVIERADQEVNQLVSGRLFDQFKFY